MSIPRLFLAILVATAGVPTARGAIQMKLFDGTTMITIDDGGVGDANPSPDVITFIGEIGVWTLNVTTGVGSGHPTQGVGSLDLNTINASSGSGTLSIMFSETGLSPAFDGWSMHWGGTLLGSPGTVTANGFVSDTNAFYAMTTPLGSLGPFSGPSFSGDITTGVSGLSTPYSLTASISITASGPLTYSGNLQLVQLSPIPEPATAAVWSLLGVAGLAFCRRWRKNPSQRP